MADRSAAGMANLFGVADYVVFSLALAASAAIGLYFACTGNKQRSTKEFLLAGGEMSVLPVAMSFFASSMSAIAIMGVPAETYYFGLMFIYSALTFIPAIFFAGYVYIPVLFTLKLTSIYEYLEIRFNRGTRILGAFCFIIQGVLLLSVVLYAPSLSLSAVTGINVWVSVITVAAVCTFYTALGGMKAVLWTDTLQTAVMYMGVLAVLIQGFITVGWSEVWEHAAASGRLDLFDPKVAFNPNPFIRQNFWSLIIGQTCAWTGTYGTSQTMVQRALSLPTLKKAQIALLINLPLLVINGFIGCVVGLVIYAYFSDCDPLTSGVITAPDQLYPLFVMEVLGHIPGLPGLIVAAVLSGALSTISSGLNALSAVVLVDMVQTFRKQPLKDGHAAIVSKIIAASFGVLATALTFLIANLGGVLEMAIAIFGICGGPLFAVFSLGMLFPQANGKGAFCGLLASLIITAWIGIGNQIHRPTAHVYPTSIEGCPLINTSTSTNSSDLYIANTTYSYSTTTSLYNITSTEYLDELTTQRPTGVDVIYSISHHYLVSIACIVCTVVALPISLITGGCGERNVDPRLISPLVGWLCCCLSPKAKEKLCCGASYTKVKTDIEDIDNTELGNDATELTTEPNGSQETEEKVELCIS